MQTAMTFAEMGGETMGLDPRTWGRGPQVLALTSIGTFLVSLDSSITTVAFRDIVADFGESERQLLAWIFSGYNIAYAAGLLTAGRFADVYGRKKSFLRGLAIFSIGSVLCGFAPSAFILVLARVLQAIGGAILAPASLALVLPEYPVEKRAAALGIWGAVGGLAAAVGPIFGGVLVDNFGWRSLFFINVPFCIFALVVGAKSLHESIDTTAHHNIDIVGAALAIPGIGLIVYGITQGEEWGWSDTGTLIAFGSAIALLALFVWRCNTSENPLLDLSLFKLPFVVAANLAGMFFSIGFFMMFFVNTQWLQNVWGYSTSGSGLAFVVGPTTAAIVAAPGGRLAQKYGQHVIITIGAVLLGGGTAALNLVVSDTVNYWVTYFPFLIITGAGVGLCITTISSAATAYLPPTRFAMGSALSNTSRQIGSALGLASAASVLTPVLREIGGARAESAQAQQPFDVSAIDLQQFHISWWIVSACMALAALSMLIFFRRPTTEQMALSNTVTSDS